MATRLARAPLSVVSEACAEKVQLMHENEKAIEEYYRTTARTLECYRATSSTPDYEKLAQAVEEAKRFADTTRRVLQRHVADHGC
jgi:Na+/phosphate symporter